MKADKTTVFAGLGGPSDGTDVPEWYREKTDLTGAECEAAPTLKETIHSLAKAKAVTPGYWDPEAEEFVKTPDKTAVVNPGWLGDGLDESEAGHALWAFAGSTYEPVNPMDMYGPFLAMARKHGLGDVYGHVEEYKLGGEVHIDLVLPSYTVDVDGTEYVLVFTTGYSHDLNRGLYVQFSAYNTETGAEWRQITDKRTCRHSKTATDKVATWWEDGIERAETATHNLATVVDEAMRYVIPLEGMPYTLTGFYEGLGIPARHEKSLADLAAGNVKAANTGGAEPDEATALALYEGLAEALTEEFEGKTDGTAATRHNRSANRLLFSPPSAEAKAIQYWQTELADQDTLDMDDREHKRALGERFGDTQAAIEHYEDTKETLKRLLNKSREDVEEPESETESEDEDAESTDEDGGDVEPGRAGA